MRHTLSNDPWKTLLPDVSDWLKSVKLITAQTSSTGTHNIVAVKPNDNDKEAINLHTRKLDQAVSQKIVAQAKTQGWRPSAGCVTLSVDGSTYTLVPLSGNKVTDKQRSRQLGLDAARVVKELQIKTLALWDAVDLDALEIFDGYASGLYGHGGFKGTRVKDLSRWPSQVVLVGSSASDKDLAAVVEFAHAQAFTRWLQDAPANYLDPIKFGDIAADLAKEYGLKHKILDKSEMEALGMGSLLGVARGGDIDPRLITIEIEGEDNSKTVALVGKGLTFDTGGISIKPSGGMDEMKYDMSGGAAVLGSARYFAKVKPPVKVICVIGASENMPSGKAVKPGDILKSMSGKTIEVLNTDAEGRLVLADCLTYVVSKYKPDLVVDIATLTGAVLMALGCVGAAVMSNDQNTADFVLKSAEANGEPLWQLPLWSELEKEIKSEVADLKNIAKSNVKGGSIIGGMFLKEFVGETKWAHLDIAGTGWNCQATGYPAAGGSAFGLRTLVATCLRYNQ